MRFWPFRVPECQMRKHDSGHLGRTEPPEVAAEIQLSR